LGILIELQTSLGERSAVTPVGKAWVRKSEKWVSFRSWGHAHGKHPHGASL